MLPEIQCLFKNHTQITHQAYLPIVSPYFMLESTLWLHFDFLLIPVLHAKLLLPPCQWCSDDGSQLAAGHSLVFCAVLNEWMKKKEEWMVHVMFWAREREESTFFRPFSSRLCVRKILRKTVCRGADPPILKLLPFRTHCYFTGQLHLTQERGIIITAPNRL